MPVRTGLERLLDDESLVPGKRWVMVANHSAVTETLELGLVALQRAHGRIIGVLGPEHGLQGTAQAGFAEPATTHRATGLKVVDTYNLPERALDEAIAAFRPDALVADIQDIGVRFYTYASTVIDCMLAAARLGIPFYVLDRPNPLSGALREGPGMGEGYHSFVGRLDIAIRHAMTLGELALEAAAAHAGAGGAAVEPVVVAMQGWQRGMTWRDTGLPWVPPSPNLPTPDSVLAYAGTALFEGTNLSEGRGTTRPFELVGAPWLDESYAEALNAQGLPGVRFRSASFVPTFSKHAGRLLGGVQLHVHDEAAFRPVSTALSMLQLAQRAPRSEFQWRTPDFESGQQRPFVDLLWGSAVLREQLADAEPDEIVRASPVAEPRRVSPLY